MAGYATVPDSWTGNPARIRDGMNRAFVWVASLTPKAAKKKPTSKR
jgi:hypothetical protein